MPYFFIFLFILIIIFILLLSSKPSKIKLKQEIIDKYKPLALDIINKNTEIKKARIKYKVTRILITFCIFLILISCVYITVSKLALAGIIFGIVLLICIYPRNKHNVLFDDIVPLILKSYNENIKYNHYSGIYSQEYSKAKFEYYDRYNSEDLITGTIQNCNYKMAEVHTQREYRDKDGNRHYQTLFRGAFAMVNLNKNFNCSINIINNKIKLFSRDNYITMDNEAFEKIYDVFTDNKILAMRLLTPDVTTKMIDLYNETGIYFEIKIVNDIMYIRLYTSKIIEINFSNKIKEATQLAVAIAQLDSIYTIMNSFMNEIERIDI